MDLCTSFSSNYVAHARVMARSFQHRHPGARCVAVLTDEPGTVVFPGNEPFDVLTPADLGVPAAAFDDMRSRYSKLELGSALKPWVLQYMLDRAAPGETVAYCDPDIRFYAPLDPVLESTRAEIVLTPHLTAPLPADGCRPNAEDIVVSGMYNAGLLALRRGRNADAMLAWWREQLRTGSVLDPQRGLHADQRCLDWVPSLFDSVAVCRDPGCNVAFWNLPGRELRRDDGRYTAGGRPLRFFHFSGFDPHQPTRLSRHQNRVGVEHRSPLEALLGSYAREVIAAGVERAARAPYVHEQLPSGLGADRYVRSLYRQATDAGALQHSIFTAQGERELVTWMNAPAPQAPGLTRYAHELWRMRPDFQAAFPEPAGADLAAYLVWCRDYGRRQVPISDPLFEGISALAPLPIGVKLPPLPVG